MVMSFLALLAFGVFALGRDNEPDTAIAGGSEVTAPRPSFSARPTETFGEGESDEESVVVAPAETPSPTPSETEAEEPTPAPTRSAQPTAEPTSEPTTEPTSEPTTEPSPAPTSTP